MIWGQRCSVNFAGTERVVELAQDVSTAMPGLKEVATVGSGQAKNSMMLLMHIALQLPAVVVQARAADILLLWAP